jgi:fatty acid-binding protein DegV
LEDLNGRFKKFADNGEMRLMVVYGEKEEDGLAFEEEMKKHFPNIPFLPCTPMSLSVACHTGPNVNVLCCLRVIE